MGCVGMQCLVGAEERAIESAGAPSLPRQSGTFEIPVQEWPLKPGPRSVKVHIRYPGPAGMISNVNAGTGLMLSLHNWGGTAFVGTADPGFLATNFNVVAIGVDYLQSGRKASIEDPEPYDFGWLQALDALRALQAVREGLKGTGIVHDDHRIFTTGGSGGGNVSLMASKLAPRTFAAVIDLCGMKKLSDDVAFNQPGGSYLNARYVKTRGDRFELTQDAQELRFLAHPQHLSRMRELGCRARIITIHGVDDEVCRDVEEYVAGMNASGLDFRYVPVTRELLDGTVFTSSGHPLGNRTLIVERVAGKGLRPGTADSWRREGPTDFDRREEIRYRTANGTWVVDYRDGKPVGRFER